MKSGTKFIRFISVLVASAAIAAACGSSSTASSSGGGSATGSRSTAAGTSGSSGGSGPTVNLGAMIPLSGVSASIGQENQQAIAIGLKKFNGSDATGGAKLQFQYRDNPGDAGTGITDLQSLVSIYHVAASITSKSTVAEAQKSLAEQDKVVLVNPGATDPTFRNLSPYVFTTVPLGDSQFAAVTKYAISQGLKRIAVVYSTDSYGQSMQPVVPKVLKQLGGTYAGGVSVSLTQDSFGTAISQLQAMHPQAVFQAFFGTGPGVLMKQSSQVGFSPVWLQTTNIDNPAALKLAGTAANGMLSSQTELANSADANEYAAAMKASGVASPSSLDDLMYANVEIFAQVIGALGKAGKKIDGPNFRSQMVNHSFPTIFGPLEYGNNGLTNMALTVTKYENGTFTPLKSYPSSALSQYSGS